MRGVICEVPDYILAWRVKTGANRFDEMWDGVIHMNPVPNRDHEELALDLYTWLRKHWAGPQRAKLFMERNVALPGLWPQDYRVPDLVLMAPDRIECDKNEYIEGPPSVVVEIRSPHDESYEKLAFYAELGVPEVWVIDRDTKVPEVFRLQEQHYAKETPDAQDWVVSRATQIRFRTTKSNTLAIQLAADDASYLELPEA